MSSTSFNANPNDCRNAGNEKASNKVSRKIAAIKNIHTSGEQLILSFSKDLITYMLGSSELKKLKHVSMLNDTVRRRIAEMSENMLSLCISKIQN